MSEEEKTTEQNATSTPPTAIYNGLILVALIGLGIGGLMTWHHEVAHDDVATKLGQ